MFDSAEDFLQTFDGSQRGCLILDIRLRGMSGLELHAHLRNRGYSIPTIFISGHIEAESCDSTDDDVVAYLEKPYDGQDLCGLVRTALATKPETSR